MVKAPELRRRGAGAFVVGVGGEPVEPKWEPMVSTTGRVWTALDVGFETRNVLTCTNVRERSPTF